MAGRADRGRAIETVRLKDGRALAYEEYGDPNGKPLFYFHGFPNSRVGARLVDRPAARDGVRVIAFDRPGFGHSDFKPGRSIGDWADDVAEAADALGIARFAVLGVSGGGPYVAACAARMPERLTAAAIVSGLGPLAVRVARKGFPWWTRVQMALGRRFHWLLRFTMWLLCLAIRWSTQRTLAWLSRSAPAADKQLLRRPEVWETLKDDFRESFRQGSAAAAWEMRLYLHPWDVRLDEIPMEVQLWHGEADRVVPLEMGRYMAGALPNCRARFYPGEGHLLLAARMAEIQRAIFP